MRFVVIRLIDGTNIDQYPETVRSMYEIRAKVFHDRLGWDVEVKDGLEIDRFDSCTPLYLVSIDSETQRVEGSLRLLQTTGPNMLRDVFSELLDEDTIVESATIWESSRFCIDPDLPASYGPTNLNRITNELLLAIAEVATRAGLGHVVSVYDARMVRIFRSAKCPVDIIGGPKRIGKAMTYVGLFEMGEATIASISKAAGIEGSVLETNGLNIPQAVAA